EFRRVLFRSPGERPRVRVDQSELVGDLAPCGAEQRTGRLHGTGPEEDAVARLRPHVRGDTGALLVREVLGHGPAELTVLTHEDVCQPLGTTLLGPLLPGVELAARLRGPALHHDGADVGRLEHAE